VAKFQKGNTIRPKNPGRKKKVVLSAGDGHESEQAVENELFRQAMSGKAGSIRAAVELLKRWEKSRGDKTSWNYPLTPEDYLQASERLKLDLIAQQNILSEAKT
jgi:hypothetical protein